MDNWAKKFQRLLEAIQENGEKSQLFLEVAADELKIDGDIRHADAARMIVLMLQSIKHDILRLGYEEADRNRLENALIPFQGLLGLSKIFYTIEQANGHFLKKEAIIGLSSIDFACRGVVVQRPVSGEAFEGIENLKAAAKDIAGSDAPAEIKFIISKRLEEVLSVVEAFQFYNEEMLQEKLDLLVGALAMSAVKDKGNSKKFGGMITCALAVVGALGTVELATGHIAKSAENVNKAIEEISELAEVGNSN